MISNQGVGEAYSDFSGSPGNSWLIFPNLPAGEYTLNLGLWDEDDVNVNGGIMPFTVETFADEQKVVIN